MTGLKIKFFLALLLTAGMLAAAQTTGTGKSQTTHPGNASAAAGQKAPAVLLPSEAQIEAALKRNFGYDPAVTWHIYDVRPSAIPGLVDVLVSMNNQNPVHLYMSPDVQYAVVGEMLPFGENPFAPAREKLKAADGPSLGPQQPVIDLVEFSDLECPHCKAAAPVMEKLANDFPQVRITFQQFPLPATMHPWAKKAAEYADCAGREKNEKKDVFWKYIDAVFENQGSIAAATADDKLKEFATATGLDAAKLSACAASPDTEARVTKSLKLGESLEVNETPTVFINGRRVRGIADIPYEQLKKLVQFEIDHAGK